MKIQISPPNALTLSRLVLAGVLMALMATSMPFSKSLALLVFIVAGITDYLDGYLARTRYGETMFGRLMDPMTDKVLVCAAFVSFVEYQVPKWGSLVPAWIVVIIISREFLVTGMRLLAASAGETIPVGKWGKHKTAWQIISIVVLLLLLAVRSDVLQNAEKQTLIDFDFALHFIALGVSLAVAAVTLASGVMYLIEHQDALSRRHM